MLSIESQIKELTELTKRLNLTVSETLTESRSAKYPGRPLFGQLMKKVSRGEVKGIISWKLDRLARNPMDGASIVWALDQGKIQEIITPSNHLRNNSNDKFLMQLEFGMAKKYVDDLSDNVRRGLRMKLEKGWLPGKAPLGYLNEPRERTIIPDPERFTVVRKLWNLLLEGILPLRIHRIASEELGLRSRTRTGRMGNPLSVSFIYKLFSNPFYYGLIQRKEGVFRGKHQAMITEEEFWRAQEILGHKGKPRPKTHSFAFTGLIRCGECGCGITAEEKTNRYGSHYTYYHCTKKKVGANCAQKVVQEHELERQMIGYLERIHLPKKSFDLAMEYLRKENKDDEEQQKTYAASVEKAYRNCVRKFETLTQMRLDELISDEEFMAQKRKMLDEKIRLEESLTHIRDGVDMTESMIEHTFTFAHDALKQFKEGTPEVRKSIIREIGSNLLLRDKKLSIDVEKPFLLIQTALTTLVSGNGRIEPPNNDLATTRSVPSDPNFLVMCTLVHDVRTYFTERATEKKHESIRLAA